MIILTIRNDRNFRAGKTGCVGIAGTNFIRSTSSAFTLMYICKIITIVIVVSIKYKLFTSVINLINRAYTFIFVYIYKLYIHMYSVNVLIKY